MRFGEKLGHGIIATGMEGVTAQNAPPSQPEAFDQPVLLQSFGSIDGTARLETTITAQHGADGVTIDPQQKQERQDAQLAPPGHGQASGAGEGNEEGAAGCA